MKMISLEFKFDLRKDLLKSRSVLSKYNMLFANVVVTF